MKVKTRLEAESVGNANKLIVAGFIFPTELLQNRFGILAE